jgi:hypothetical protein
MSVESAVSAKEPFPRSEVILAMAVLGVVAVLVMPLPALVLTDCSPSASALACSSCWSRWVWLARSTFPSSLPCCSS